MIIQEHPQQSLRRKATSEVPSIECLKCQISTQCRMHEKKQEGVIKETNRDNSEHFCLLSSKYKGFKSGVVNTFKRTAKMFRD